MLIEKTGPSGKVLSGKVLETELDWFRCVLEARIAHYFHHEGTITSPLEIPPPQPTQPGQADCHYAKLVKHYNLSPEERLVLMLALAPDIKPELLDLFFQRNHNFGRGFSQFGGHVGSRHSGFIPTLETAYFLLSGRSVSLRLRYTHFFQSHHVFQSQKFLDLDYGHSSEPSAGTPLRLNPDLLDMLILGYIRDPETSVNFPAKRLETRLEWDDIVFAPQTLEQLKELRTWLEHENQFLDDWQFRRTMKPGYKCLFYGPPGTGKTLTASLLGKLSNRAVYRIDLSQLISKYIGETEKNLEQIFTQAQRRDWILFFDEADSVFGKRTSVSDAHDRNANQGTAYLLQRIEDCPNVVILASNYKANIDEAFFRRFQSAIHFPIPRKQERLKLWTKGFSPVSTLESEISLEEVADQYEMAGGAIMNVIRFSSLMAIAKKSRIIAYDDLITGIQREFNKEGRTV
ncbi:MAG: ATP-binding protein [bacterium]|nr:ATP-binding protein [bacterium]